MDVFRLVMYIIAALLFLFAFLGSSMTGDGTNAMRKWNLIALGLLAWVSVPLVDAIDRLGD